MADWDKITSHGNVEDRRGMGPLAIGGGGLGVVGVIVVLLFNVLTGNPTDLNGTLNQLQGTGSSQQSGDTAQFEGKDSYEEFAGAVLGSANDVWRDIFAENGKSYTDPRLVLFRTATQSACGSATSSVGPHYCPADSTIYIDETFFDVLTERFGAEGGDVAEAYVIAHEVGHHVQNELGTMDAIQSARQSGDADANELAVQLELQADCFAGVWAHSVAELGVFQPGEINEAIDAAEAVGDDRIQSRTSGQVNPETWTHGSSEQRAAWFNRGFESGRPANCDTFRS